MTESVTRKGLIIVEVGAGRGRTFTLEAGKPAYAGRDPRNEYRIISSEASRVHCKFANEGGRYTVTDLDSKNGTRVNGKQITSVSLRDGDLIEVARVRFRFQLASPEGAGVDEAQRPIFMMPKPVPRPKPRSVPVPKDTRIAPGPDDVALVGKTVGEFRLIAAVARGRRTVIYKATQPSRNRVVAVRLLAPELAQEKAAVAWFVAGVKRAGQLRHEDVVRTLGGGKHEDLFFQACEYMEGGDAVSHFRDAPGGGIKIVKKALQSVIRVSRALEYATNNGILHLGVRPEKVLFNEKDLAKLSSLGFDNGPATFCDNPMPPEAEPYFAPEQKHEESPTRQIDMYGLGATFYYMLTGAPPSRMRGTSKQLVSAKSYNRAVPDSLCRILERMLEESKTARYESYGALLHDLRWALRGETWSKE